MSAIKRKLNSQSGVSILLALLAVVVATTISALVISAAVTAVQSASKDREREQKMLCLESALRTVMNDTDEKSYSIETVTEKSSGNLVSKTPTNNAGNYLSMMKRIVTLMDDGSTDAEVATMTVSVNGADVQDVSVTCRLNKTGENWQLLYVFSIDGFSETVRFTEKVQKVTVEFDKNEEVVDPVSKTSVTVTRHYKTETYTLKKERATWGS